MQKSSSNPIRRIRPSSAKVIFKAVELLYSVDAVDYSELQATRVALSALVRGELPSEPEDKLVSQEQVAAAFGVGLSTLKRLLATGEVVLPRKKVGGAVRYRWKDVVVWMNAVEVEETSVHSDAQPSSCGHNGRNGRKSGEHNEITN